MNTSPDRGSFHIECEIKSLHTGRKTQEEAYEMIDFYKTQEQRQRELEQDPEWQIDNMEYDLRSTKWICDKVKSSEVYAQNLYAAMCNREFTKNDVWPLLQDKRWDCSWRYAGGIVCHMKESGDYIDYYCSGIRGQEDLSDEEYAQLDKAQQESYIQSKLRVEKYVGEGNVTDEVKEDLLKLGWIVIDDE
jgi:hypothetical protein